MDKDWRILHLFLQKRQLEVQVLNIVQYVLRVLFVCKYMKIFFMFSI